MSLAVVLRRRSPSGLPVLRINCCTDIWDVAQVASQTGRQTKKGGELSTEPRERSEREKWEADVRLREREVLVTQREQATSLREVEAKIEELKRSRWTSPIVLAVLGAALAASGNAVVALINGVQQRATDERHATAENLLQTNKADAERQLEEGKADAARILEVIKTNDPDKAAENLAFLLQAGLIIDTGRRESLTAYLKQRPDGQGPALPSPVTITRTVQQRIVAFMRAIRQTTDIATLTAVAAALELQPTPTTNNPNLLRGVIISAAYNLVAAGDPTQEDKRMDLISQKVSPILHNKF